jgi:hypothetical protein
MVNLISMAKSPFFLPSLLESSCRSATPQNHGVLYAETLFLALCK